MLMDTPDETLAEAAAGGDRAAFAVLLGRHYDRIFALAFRLTGSRADAEDLAQEICAALPAKLARWRAEARFTTWLYRVVVNATHDLRRRQAVRSRAAAGWGDWEIARQDQIAEEFTTNQSDGGNFLGRYVARRRQAVNLSVSHLSEDWKADVLDDLIGYLTHYPGFVADRPLSAPKSVIFGYLAEKPIPERNIPNRAASVSVSMDFIGHVA